MSARSKKKSNRIRFSPDGLLDRRSVFSPLTQQIMSRAYENLKKDAGPTAEKIIGEAQARLASILETERTDAGIIAICYLLNSLVTKVVSGNGTVN